MVVEGLTSRDRKGSGLWKMCAGLHRYLLLIQVCLQEPSYPCQCTVHVYLPLLLVDDIAIINHHQPSPTNNNNHHEPSSTINNHQNHHQPSSTAQMVQPASLGWVASHVRNISWEFPLPWLLLFSALLESPWLPPDWLSKTSISILF